MNIPLRFAARTWRLTFLIVGFGLLAQAAFAQIRNGQLPYSFASSASLEGLPGYTTPLTDWGPIRLADSLNNLQKDRPFRFGHSFTVSLDLMALGQRLVSPEGIVTIRYRLVSPGAKSINLVLSRFHLPQGSYLYMYTPNRAQVLGGWGAINHNPERVLGTDLIWSSEAILELNYPADAEFRPEVAISQIVHGYGNNKNALSFGSSGACNMNINCPKGQKWQNQKRSVAVIIQGAEICTGSLINNVREDGTPFFLTANHCFSNQATTWVFAFNWESPTCANPPTNPSRESVSGCVVRARNSASDVMLLQFNNRVPDSYNVYFNGWDRSGAVPDSGAGIHHPDGDIKKLSIFSQAAISSLRGNPQAQCWELSWDLLTTTEGGSSGSPLYNQNGLVIGQLYGGQAACGNTSPDWYGKFSISWDFGSTPASRLKDWLDPDNVNPITLPGINGQCLAIRPILPYTEGFNQSISLPARWDPLESTCRHASLSIL